MVVGAPGLGAFFVALTSMSSSPAGRSAHGLTGRARGYESLFLGVNFLNFPDVWNLRFCKVRRVNLGQVSGGVESPSDAPMRDKKRRSRPKNAKKTRAGAREET